MVSKLIKGYHIMIVNDVLEKTFLKEKMKMNLQSASNTELFRQFVEQGSKEAISIFFQNQTDLFYRVALKYTKNTADAEDVIQSAFINIIDKASQYNGVSSNEEKLLRSWCLSVVVQCALMKIKIWIPN